MAITITQEPETLIPASNPCRFVFESDNYTQLNFSFIVTLQVNGVDHSVHQVFPESSGHGRFDCSEILSAILSSNINENEDLINSSSNNWLQYRITVQEKTGTPPKPIGTIVESTLRFVFNGAFRFLDWKLFDYADYSIFNTVNTPLFSTNYPRSNVFKGAEFCGMSQKKYLSFLLVSGSFEVTFKVLDISGSVIAQDTISSTPSLEDDKVITIDASPEKIIDETTITLANFDSAYGYSIEAGNGFQSSTEQYYIVIDRDCERYEHRRLQWLNKFGVWDSFTFKLRSKETTKVKREGYTSEAGTWTNDNEFLYPTYQGEDRNSLVTSKDSIEINSDWVSEAVQNWLAQSLLESPKIYLETSEGFELLIPETLSFEKKKRFSDGLIQESYKFKRTHIYKSQLG